MRLINIQNERGIKKDPRSGAIVNVDDSAYQTYLRRKNSMEQRDTELQELKNELQDVKELLQQLLSKK